MDANFWSGKRPPGVVDTINPDEFKNVVEVLETSVKKYADRPAFTSVFKTFTWGEIDRLSADFAAYLQNCTNLQPGDRVALMMPNIVQFPIAAYGAIRAGMVLVNTNPLYTVREMKHQFNDSGAKALIFMDTFGDRVQEVLPETGIETLIVTSLADMREAPKRWLINGAVKHIKKMVPEFNLPQAIKLRSALKQGAKHEMKPGNPSADDVAVLQYTGGTTGVAKGAMLTHRNLVANMLQVRASLQQENPETGRPFMDIGQETIIAPLPLYHIYAFTCHCMCMMSLGNHSVLVANPRDPDMFIKIIKPYQFTALAGLNTLFVSLMQHPEFKNLDFSKLKLTLSGGTALVRATADKWKEITGCDIGEGFGMTETSPAVSLSPVGDYVKHGTVGMPVASTDIRLVDDDGVDVPAGERGELCVRGPQVMKGYWKRPEATAETFLDGEWLKTGDVAQIDEDGYISIVDRKKDMILVSGFNVYPNEIEDVVAKLPGVEHAAAIGVPDEKSGEAVKLFIVPEDKSLTIDQVKAYCRENLAGYKVPKHYEFREELPMTNVGKILRRELRDAEVASN